MEELNIEAFDKVLALVLNKALNEKTAKIMLCIDRYLKRNAKKEGQLWSLEKTLSVSMHIASELKARKTDVQVMNQNFNSFFELSRTVVEMWISSNFLCQQKVLPLATEMTELLCTYTSHNKQTSYDSFVIFFNFITEVMKEAESVEISKAFIKHTAIMLSTATNDTQSFRKVETFLLAIIASSSDSDCIFTCLNCWAVIARIANESCRVKYFRKFQALYCKSFSLRLNSPLRLIYLLLAQTFFRFLSKESQSSLLEEDPMVLQANEKMTLLTDLDAVCRAAESKLHPSIVCENMTERLQSADLQSLFVALGCFAYLHRRAFAILEAKTRHAGPIEGCLKSNQTSMIVCKFSTILQLMSLGGTENPEPPNKRLKKLSLSGELCRVVSNLSKKVDFSVEEIEKVKQSIELLKSVGPM